MVDLYRGFESPLSHTMLFEWHKMLTNGRCDLKDIGQYRTHLEPMQIVSGAIYAPNAYFEAPPSSRMIPEMDRFIAWFNNTAPKGKTPLPALLRAGISHLYFVSIHPFEDGNGRDWTGACRKSAGTMSGSTYVDCHCLHPSTQSVLLCRVVVPIR